MKVVEHELAHGVHDYLPVVDPATDRLVGMLSARDVLRARSKADLLARTAALDESSPSTMQTLTNSKEA
jgi:CBS domain-containing protein